MSAARPAYIAGAAQQVQKELPGWEHAQMMAVAGRRALGDAGLSLRDVDALFGCSGPGALAVAEYMGIPAAALDATMIGGASSLAHVAHACELIANGKAEVILIVHSGRNRSVRKSGSPPTAGVWSAEFQDPFGIPAPIGLFAMGAQLHMDRYGTRSEHFAEIAVAAREWARMNPEALERQELSIADVLASPMISEPLHLLDCCLVTDAAGAIVVTSAAVAENAGRNKVRIAGTGQAHSHITLTQWEELDRTAAGISAERALGHAGIGLNDIDVLELYDAVTSHVLMMLEDIGFCPKGEGGAFVADGKLRPGGKLPMNTQGGGLSFTHPGMFGIFTVIEAYRQLTQAYAGSPRQVADAEVALSHGIGYIAGAHCSLVLTRH